MFFGSNRPKNDTNRFCRKIIYQRGMKFEKRHTFLFDLSGLTAIFHFWQATRLSDSDS